MYLIQLICFTSKDIKQVYIKQDISKDTGLINRIPLLYQFDVFWASEIGWPDWPGPQLDDAVMKWRRKKYFPRDRFLWIKPLRFLGKQINSVPWPMELPPKTGDWLKPPWAETGHLPSFSPLCSLPSWLWLSFSSTFFPLLILLLNGVKISSIRVFRQKQLLNTN